MEQDSKRHTVNTILSLLENDDSFANLRQTIEACAGTQI